jgi:hypothetical protein
MPVFLLVNKNTEKRNIKYPIEIVESIKKGTRIGTKYEVKIKRIELRETSYILHTDSNYNVNDTIQVIW